MIEIYSSLEDYKKKESIKIFKESSKFKKKSQSGQIGASLLSSFSAFIVFAGFFLIIACKAIKELEEGKVPPDSLIAATTSTMVAAVVAVGSFVLLMASIDSRNASANEVKMDLYEPYFDLLDEFQDIQEGMKVWNNCLNSMRYQTRIIGREQRAKLNKRLEVIYDKVYDIKTASSRNSSSVDRFVRMRKKRAEIMVIIGSAIGALGGGVALLIQFYPIG